MKIVASVPVYNRERFIGAYLEMLKGFGVEPVVTLGNKSWANHAGDESSVPDRTELILNKFFPDVKVLRGDYSHHRDSMNVGVRYFNDDYDLCIINDCDMFMTSDDWNRMLDFVKSNYEGNDAFSTNHNNMIVEYYYDHRFGTGALQGGDPPIFAIKHHVEMKHMTQSSSNYEAVWDDPVARFHHMRFCQKGRNDRRCNEPTVGLERFKPAPPEIFNLLEKWQEILKTL